MLQPVSSIYPDIIEAFFLQFLFVCVVAITYIIASSAIPFKRASYSLSTHTLRNTDYVQHAIVIGYVLSTIGLCFLIYDKLYVQDIDYSQGISVAREQWRSIGEARDGAASSIFSVLGYLIGSAYFTSLALLVSKSVQIRHRTRILGIIIGVIFLALNSLLTGGRSNILLAVAFLAYASREKTYQIPAKYLSRFSKTIVLFISIAAIFYLLYVFSLRSEANGISTADYSLEFLEYLGLEPKLWFTSLVLNWPQFGEYLALINLAFSYLTHSLATTAAIIGHGVGNSVVVFNYAYLLLYKLDIVQTVNTDWFLSGRFPSLPGGLYLQSGLIGLTVFSLILGIASAFTNTLYRTTKKTIGFLIACCCLETILLLSPFLFAGDFLSFPFIITGAFLAAFFAKIPKIHL